MYYESLDFAAHTKSVISRWTNNIALFYLYIMEFYHNGYFRSLNCVRYIQVLLYVVLGSYAADHEVHNYLRLSS
jgi:hypothetical protein